MSTEDFDGNAARSLECPECGAKLRGTPHLHVETAAEGGEVDLIATAGRLAQFGGWSFDLDRWEVQWSDEVYAIHEMTPGTPVDFETAVSCYHPGDQWVIRERAMACMGAGVPWDEELRLLTAKGKERWVRTLGTPVKDSEGTIIGLQGALQDVTRRRKAEERATGLERRLAQTLQSIGDAFFTLDEEWNFTFVNAEACRIFQRTTQELIGSNCWEIFPEMRGTELEENSVAAMSSTGPRSFEVWIPRREIWVSVRAYRMEDGLAVCFQDTTERHRHLTRIAQQASLLERAQDVIVVWELDGEITLWNASATRVLGWEESEAIGATIEDRLSMAPATAAAARDELMQNGEWSGELRCTHRDGTEVTLEARWTLLHGGDNEPSRVLAINTDVTERNRLMSQFLRAQRLESIGTLAGGIAHDLNNVLTPILMSVGLLREDISDPWLVESIDSIEESARRGANLIQQVMTFSRGAEGDRTPVEVSEAIGEILRLIRETFPRDIQIHPDLSDDLWPILGDATHLHQVLMNLCVNARDAMPEGGRLTIRVRNVEFDDDYGLIGSGQTAGRYVSIDVIDTGTGMDEATLKRAFDPFFTTKELGKGTGIGLSTVDSLVRNHGGFVHAYSEVGVGSRFRVCLPVACEPHPEATPIEESGRPAGQGETILLIDDEELIREHTGAMLSRNGYAVLSAGDGAEGIEVFREHHGKIQAVVVDLMMPVMSGYEAMRAIRTIDPTVPMIAVSGLCSDEKLQKVEREGGCELVNKPYRASTVLQALARALGR